MLRNKLAVILVISLAFNLAVLIVFAANLLDSEEESYRYCDPHVCRAFARRFGLRPSAADSFAMEMNRYREEEEELREEIMKARIELMDLFHSPEPDSNAIDSRVEKISELQGELEKIVVRRLLRANSVLSDSEKVRFHRILRRRMHMDRKQHPPVFNRGGRCEEF
jgi:Spy/CpxP family protein refolding chaperone